MLNFAIIICKKWINGDIVDCVFMGNKQGDGYIYFNDDIFYRCTDDKENLQIFYPQNRTWVRTDIIEIEEIYSLDAIAAQNLINGGGSFAANADVEKAVKWAIDKVNNNYITYDEPPRVTAVGDFNATQYDCSSFIITAFLYAGFDVTGATYTGNMRAYFEPQGFKWYPGSTWYAEDLKRGDILLQETYHTQMYIGDGQDVNCGSTPGMVASHWDFYVNNEQGYYGGWDGILRYEG